ncbi:MAG TPA: crossover junction endodeoxyribonuclease RuvC [Chlamydiales bacterium]|nr:crossover junction endodeoxyribonuclease RuvC [Chlamydiales bacterium]
MKTRILGVDPGTRITGYGIIDSDPLTPIDFGCIKPDPKSPMQAKYFQIFKGICRLIENYKPHAISIETQFVQKNVQSAMKLGMARAAVLIAAESYQIPVFEYAPKKAKLSVVGIGTASKSQVQRMTQNLLKLSSPPTPEDAADALALAICHLHQIPFQKKRCLCTNISKAK